MPSTQQMEPVCPACRGSGMTNGVGGMNERFDQTCYVCQGAGKLWCAMCGKWGNHRSGGCSLLKHLRPLNNATIT